MALESGLDRSALDRAVDSTLAHWTLLGASALWVGLLGPAWLHVPPQPKVHLPAMDPNFASLADISLVSQNSDYSFFNWGAWFFAVAATALLVALAVTRSRPVRFALGLTCLGGGLAAIATTLLACTSLPSNADAWHVVTGTRLGLALYLAGLASTVLVGSARAGQILHAWLDPSFDEAR